MSVSANLSVFVCVRAYVQRSGMETEKREQGKCERFASSPLVLDGAAIAEFCLILQTANSSRQQTVHLSRRLINEYKRIE